MKGLRLVLIIAFVVASLLVSAVGVSAQSGTWVSGIMVQNQSETDPADITITFYWAEGEALAGQVAYVHTATIPAGGSQNFYVPSLAGLPTGFVGSAVVSANQPIAANLNTQVPTSSGTTTSDPNRVGTASGVLTGSTSLYFTQVMKAYYGWNSYVAVQNTSPDTQANVSVTYYDGSGAVVDTDSITIKPNTTYILRQAENGDLADGYSGSVVVTGDQPLAGIANFYAAGTDSTSAQFHSYNAAGAGATTLYAPRIVRHYYGYEGGLRIQNVGSSATDVTITYKFGGTDYVDTITALAPGAARDFYMGNDIPALGTVSGTGSVMLQSSGQPIIATVNEDNRTEGRGTTYNAIADGAQTNALLFPQVTSRYYGYSGGVQVQNVGGSMANVVVTFSAAGHSDATVSTTIAAGASKDWFAPNFVANPNFNGTVTVTSDQPIVGIANFSFRQDVQAGDGWGVNYGDSYVTYNGINK